MKPAQRSSLITTVAWCLIVTFTLMALLSFLQGLIFFFLVPHEQVEGAIAQARAIKSIPEWGIDILRNIQWIAAVFFVASVFLLNTGIALLKRREWARQTTIAMLALSILAMLPGFIYRYDPTNSSLPMNDEMKATMEMMQTALLAMNALFCAIHGWLIWKLRTPGIRAEFLAAPLPSTTPSETGIPSA